MGEHRDLSISTATGEVVRDVTGTREHVLREAVITAAVGWHDAHRPRPHRNPRPTDEHHCAQHRADTERLLFDAVAALVGINDDPLTRYQPTLRRHR